MFFTINFNIFMLLSLATPVLPPSSSLAFPVYQLALNIGCAYFPQPDCNNTLQLKEIPVAAVAIVYPKSPNVIPLKPRYPTSANIIPLRPRYPKSANIIPLRPRYPKSANIIPLRPSKAYLDNLTLKEAWKPIPKDVLVTMFLHRVYVTIGLVAFPVVLANRVLIVSSGVKSFYAALNAVKFVVSVAVAGSKDVVVASSSKFMTVVAPVNSFICMIVAVIAAGLWLSCSVFSTTTCHTAPGTTRLSDNPVFCAMVHQCFLDVRTSNPKLMEEWIAKDKTDKETKAKEAAEAEALAQLQTSSSQAPKVKVTVTVNDTYVSAAPLLTPAAASATSWTFSTPDAPVRDLGALLASTMAVHDPHFIWETPGSSARGLPKAKGGKPPASL